jgi:hypothetical protein
MEAGILRQILASLKSLLETGESLEWSDRCPEGA